MRSRVWSCWQESSEVNRSCQGCKAGVVGSAWDGWVGDEVAVAVAMLALRHRRQKPRSAPQEAATTVENMSKCNYDGLFASFLYTLYAYRPPRAPCLKMYPKIARNV
jgi:hypothetical protein